MVVLKYLAGYISLYGHMCKWNPGMEVASQDFINIPNLYVLFICKDDMIGTKSIKYGAE